MSGNPGGQRSEPDSDFMVSREALEGPLLSLSTEPGLLPNLAIPPPQEERKVLGAAGARCPVQGPFSWHQSRGTGFRATAEGRRCREGGGGAVDTLDGSRMAISVSLSGNLNADSLHLRLIAS